ncbi:ectomycorrhiza-induced ankyrin-domain/NACHT-domain-containing protein [Mycena vulgaris]|nr:ectomycorrhiza-induced ankyrin-domain/NACHT-domain-containing protein [Mycena vulgaris]
MPDHFRKWVRGLRPESRPSSRASASAPASTPLQPAPPSASEPPSVDPKATSPAANVTIDNLTVALGLVQQVTNVVQRVPFIAPAAALMSELLKVYKEVKDTDDKRAVLLANITGLARDLCGTILRMEATNHVDLIGRLKADIEAYAGLLGKASRFIRQYDNQGITKHVAARNELVQDQPLGFMTWCHLEEKLEKWLACPDMKEKQFETQELRHEGTGQWLLEGDGFIQWEDNPGSLWIRGPSGAGKSVLSSTVISQLVDDQRGFKDLADAHPPPAIAFLYFDFKHKQGHAIDSGLRRIILQLSAQSPNPYKTLEKHFKSKSKGQTLPTYQELQKILEELLLELGRTYIILDALDECEERDHGRLVDFISTLRRWTQTPLHLLLTSQPRRIFMEAFADVTCIELDSDLTQEDIRHFVESELQRLEPWAQQAADVVVSKSNGMFRMAACLIVEVSHCPWEDELDKILENLPKDLFGIYDRFMQAIRPEHLLYAQAALRWLVFSQEKLTLERLADAIAFDFSEPKQYIYKPGRREGNAVAIPKWLEGLATFTGPYYVVLAHSSVQDYLMSTRFADEFGCDFSAGLSHTFLAQTCIGYLLQFADHPLGKEGLLSHPLARYAATRWCRHLLHSHDRTVLFGGAMRLLEDGTEPYKVLKQAVWNRDASPLHLCCEEGYIEGVRRHLETGADINLQSRGGSPLQVASRQGHTEIVGFLLENSADVNATGGEDGAALQAAAREGYIEIVCLLLENGADVNRTGGHDGPVLQIASKNGYTRIVSLLLENGADANATGGEDGTALQAAAREGHIEIVCLLLVNGADVNTGGGYSGSALQAAARRGHIEIVRLLLENGADVNATGEEDGTALQAAAGGGHIEIVCLLLVNGADVSARGGYSGSALQAASSEGYTEIVHLLLENGADVNASGGADGSALQAASWYGHIEIVCLLLKNGVDVNTSGGADGRVLQVAPSEGHIESLHLLLENGADLNTGGGYSGSALQAASSAGHTEIVRLLLENGADVNTIGGDNKTALQAASRYGHTEIVDLLLEKGAVDTRLEESDSDTESVEVSEWETTDSVSE